MAKRKNPPNRPYICFSILVCSLVCAHAQTDPLPSWNDIAPKKAILGFVGLELLAYLRARGFRTYIVSGGGIDFMRPWTEKAYGVPPE